MGHGCFARNDSGYILRLRGTLPNDTEGKKEADEAPSNEKNTRFDGWGEIASFLGRGIRTVRRWEKDAALPVRRLFRGHRCPVYAYRNELAAWVSHSGGTLSQTSVCHCQIRFWRKAKRRRATRCLSRLEGNRNFPGPECSHGAATRKRTGTSGAATEVQGPQRALRTSQRTGGVAKRI